MRNHEEQTEQPKQVAGENKTYEQRLREVAYEFAKEVYSEDCIKMYADKEDRWISEFKPLAAIALKYMAEEWKDGYDFGWWDKDYNSEFQLINRGLIQPQKP